jgi:hypothetical protein
MSWLEKNGTVGFAALLVLTDMAHQMFSFPAHGAEVLQLAQEWLARMRKPGD